MSDYVEQDINKILLELLTGLKALKIPVSLFINPAIKINSRAKRRLGCCILKNGMYTIEVSEKILCDKQLLEKTIVHELLHTCPGCFSHGDRWKSYAAIAGNALGHEIRRTETARPEDCQPLRQDTAKYLLVCTDCGKNIERMRMCKLVKSPYRYRCMCGGKLKRVL